MPTQEVLAGKILRNTAPLLVYNGFLLSKDVGEENFLPTDLYLDGHVCTYVPRKLGAD